MTGGGRAGLAVAEYFPDQAGQPGRPDNLGRRVQFRQRPPPPGGDAIGCVHRGNVAQLTAGPVNPRQEQALMLPDGPTAVLHGPHLPVNLAQQGNITPAGLLGKLTARGVRKDSPGFRPPPGVAQ